MNSRVPGACKRRCPSPRGRFRLPLGRNNLTYKGVGPFPLPDILLTSPFLSSTSHFSKRNATIFQQEKVTPSHSLFLHTCFLLSSDQQQVIMSSITVQPLFGPESVGPKLGAIVNGADIENLTGKIH